MSTIYEMKHVKNLTNFETLISLVGSYGKAYQPTNPALKLENLQAKAIRAHQVIEQLNALLPSYSNAMMLREVAFEPLAKLRNRFFELLKTTGEDYVANDEDLSLQTYYDNMLESLAEQVKLLAASPAKSSGQIDLHAETLMTLYNDLHVKNETAINQIVQLNNAKLNCNQVMYHEETGLVSIAQLTKRYIQSLYSEKNSNYQKVSILEFYHLNI
jgi:hypothetical protein